MRTRRIAVISEQPLSARDESRFGFSVWRQGGFRVLVLDLSPYYFPHLKTVVPPQLTLAESCRITTPRQLTRSLTDLDDSDAVLFIGQCALQGYRQARVVTAALQTRAAAFAFLGASIPSPTVGLNGTPSLKSRLSLRFDREALKISKVPLAANLIQPGRPLDIVWAATSFSKVNPLLIQPGQTALTLIHSLDVDRHLRASQSTAQHGALVLLDSMGPLHPDFDFEGSMAPCSIDDYRRRMELLLELVEVASGRVVIVAGHPRSNPGVARQLYGGRRVEWGDTYNVVAGGAGVIMAEPTTSLGMAVLQEKPILLIDTDIMGNFASQYLDLCGVELGIPVLHTGSDPNEVQEALAMSPTYARYLNAYLKKPGTPEMDFWSVAVGQAIDFLS